MLSQLRDTHGGKDILPPSRAGLYSRTYHTRSCIRQNPRRTRIQVAESDYKDPS